MISNENFPTIVWIGRYTGTTGLSVAAQGYVSAIRHHGHDVVQLDLESGEIVGPPTRALLDVRKNDKQTILQSPNRPLVVVFNDTPDKLDRVSCTGVSRLIALSMFETDSIPASWLTPLLAVDEVWVPSEFNIETFARAGVPKDALTKIPVPLARGPYLSELTRLKLGQRGFTYLSVVSNYNRKDIGLLLRAYFKSFSAEDDVTLIVKLPQGTEQSHFERFVTNAIEPEFSLSNPKLPHVIFLKGNLSGERMLGLMASCDCYVSTERGKGWDLPAMEAMALGKPTVGIDWSGNTEFMTAKNSVLVEAGRSLVDTDPSLFINALYYAGHQWSYVSDDAVAAAMKQVFDDRGLAARIGRAARNDILANFTEEKVGRMILDRIGSYDQSHYRSHKTAQLVADKNGPVPIPRAPKGVIFEDLADLHPILTEKPSPRMLAVQSARDAWIADRRMVWGAHGTVLPPHAERERIGALKDSRLGEKIVIVGNGPSLKKTNFDLLENVASFGVNRICLLYDKVKWRPTYYTCLDWRVTPDNYGEINDLREGATYFFPFRFHGMLREGDDVFWYESASSGAAFHDKFEGDARRPLRGGGTVLTAAIQLAWHMGFRDIALIGVDASYSVPETVLQSGGDRFGSGTQLNLTSTADDDENHFDERYFGTNARWHDPNVPEMIRGFINCRRAIEFRGGRLVNATVGGRLEALDRVDLAEWVKGDDGLSGTANAGRSDGMTGPSEGPSEEGEGFAENERAAS